MILESMLQPHQSDPVTIIPPDCSLRDWGYNSRGRRRWWLPGLLVLSLGVGLVMPGAAIAQAKPALAIAPAELRPTLRLGNQGAGVEELQGILALLGYHPSPVDGSFDADTEASVQAFQTDVGLTADGIVGPATWERLLPNPSTEFTPPAAPVAAAAPETPPAQNTSSNPAPTPERSPIDLPTLRVGTYGPAVTRLQTRLQSLGFYNGALDGIFGSQTESAVKAFQRDAQILTDGIVGASTWAALLR